MARRKNSDVEDILTLAALGFVAAMAYYKWYPGKSLEDVLSDVDSKIRGFLDTIELPDLQQLPGLGLGPGPGFVPDKDVPPPPIPFQPTVPTTTNTVADPDNNEEGKVREPLVKPADSGQLSKNPSVPPPPTGSGGALIAFAGDWDSNAKAAQTSAMIDKQGCQLIVGVGDYSYSDEKAIDWFNKNVGPRWKGKMKGCIGNHDVHDPSGFLSLFGQTGWNVGAKIAPTLSVIFIDTEKGISESVLTSLTTAAKSQSKHIIYVFHKPFITSANGHHKPSENKWGSIIDKVAKANGVKLLIAGHNHLYEHFTCGGIHYVTSGAAGRKFYAGNCQGSCGPVKCVENTNGFLKVAAGNTLLCQFVSNSGQVLDSFNIA